MKLQKEQVSIMHHVRFLYRPTPTPRENNPVVPEQTEAPPAKLKNVNSEL
jgi:hypothetical protein